MQPLWPLAAAALAGISANAAMAAISRPPTVIRRRIVETPILARTARHGATAASMHPLVGSGKPAHVSSLLAGCDEADLAVGLEHREADVVERGQAVLARGAVHLRPRQPFPSHVAVDEAAVLH